MYGCENWTIKKAESQKINAFGLWCWRRLESPLDCQEANPINSKGDQSWILFFGRIDVEAETPILWPPDVKNWLSGKDPDARRLKVGGEGDDRGWDDWVASPTQWTCVWARPGSWWWTGKPDMLQDIHGVSRVRQDWQNELWTFPVTTPLNHSLWIVCIHKACGSVKDTAPQEMSWGRLCSRSKLKRPIECTWCFFFFF